MELFAISSLCVPLAHCGPPRHNPQGSSAEVPPLAIALRQVRIGSFLSDRVELSASVDVTPAVEATLEHVRFDSMRVDGKTPVYMEPIAGQIKLRRNIAESLPTVHMAMYYSDFPTPSTMQAVLDANSMHVIGNVRANVRLNIVSKLFLRDSHPTAAVHLDQDVPLDRGAVNAPTQAAVGLLSLAQDALQTSVSILDRVAGVRVSSNLGVATPQEVRPVVIVRTTYRLAENAGAELRSCEGLGFWLDQSHLVLPDEMLEPWLYSTDFATALAMGTTKLDEASVVTTIRPAMSMEGSQNVFSLGAGDFRVQRRGNSQQTRLLLASGNTAVIRERESTGNFAVLEFVQYTGLPVRVSDADDSGNATVLRRGRASETVLQHLELDRIADAGQLPRPVDDTIFGSPVIQSGGVVGMVVGEHTVVPLSALR